MKTINPVEPDGCREMALAAAGRAEQMIGNDAVIHEADALRLADMSA